MKMVGRQNGIGSVSRMVTDLESGRPRKKRKKSKGKDETSTTHDAQNTQNTNQRDPVSGDAAPKTEDEEIGPLTPALRILAEKMDIFEREKLEKQEFATFSLTMKKMEAIRRSIEQAVNTEPHLIGSIPQIASLQQDEVAFNSWMWKFRDSITADPAIGGDPDMFIQQLASLKSDANEWQAFLTKWKWNRIFYADRFGVVWGRLKQRLGLETPERNPEEEREEKQVMDLRGKEEEDDEDEDDDIVLEEMEL